MAERKNGGELNDTYKALAEALKQQEPQRGGRLRRAGGRNDKLKDSGYSLPQIVIRQEPMGTNRIGGI